MNAVLGILQHLATEGLAEVQRLQHRVGVAGVAKVLQPKVALRLCMPPTLVPSTVTPAPPWHSRYCRSPSGQSSAQALHGTASCPECLGVTCTSPAGGQLLHKRPRQGACGGVQPGMPVQPQNTICQTKLSKSALCYRLRSSAKSTREPLLVCEA